jgi:hypothetical protein
VAADLFEGRPISFAVDDGMPFPGWAPPPLDEQEARDRYEDGDRFAVLAGPPSDPVAAMVLDRRNGRAVVTTAEPARRLVFTGRHPLRLQEASWQSRRGDEPVDLAAERFTERLLRVRRRRGGVPVWVENLFAVHPQRPTEQAEWPEFGDWTGLARDVQEPGEQWWDEPAEDLVDADGWLLDVLDELDLAARWRDLARRYDAPRAYGLPPPVQAKLAEPRDWRSQGRRWRRAGEAAGATVLTDVSFVAGAGGGCDVAVTVLKEPVEVVVTLPAATARLEARRAGRVGSPAQPRPSASAQVAIVAVLELAAEVFDAVTAAVADGAVPDGWQRLRS